MSRDISLTAKQALFDPETDEVFIVLLTIDHADLTNPIRVCSDGVDVTSNLEVFRSFPFDITLPDESGDRGPVARLAIDNVSREIVQSIRSIDSAPSVQIDIIRSDSPDTIEVSFPNFKLSDVSYDALVVEGALTLDDFLAEPYPAARFDPARFPGLF